ncbi:LysR family transcriptional regulator [Allostella vacuolata]|nr:LysR family transcriptional regulator [Stella vacuolata]
MQGLRQLRLILRIAETGSLSHAAAAEGMAQPAMSRLLRQAEEELGARLFYRHGRGVALTDGGRRFVAHAREIVRHYEELSSEIDELRKNITGGATVGMPPGIARMVMVPLVLRFKRLYPAATLRLQESFTGDAPELLAAGRLDVGAYYLRASAAAQQGEPILVEDAHVIGLAGNPALAGDEITLTQAVSLPLIMPSRVGGIRGNFNDAVASLGLRPEIRVEVDAIDSMLHLVDEGIGCTIVPFSVAKVGVERGIYRASRIVQPPITRQITLAGSTHHPLTPTAREAIRIFRELLIELAPKARWTRWQPAMVDPARAAEKEDL